jgi:hypothetical protein
MEKLGLIMRETDKQLVRKLSPMASRMAKKESSSKEQYDQEKEASLQGVMKAYGVSREEALKIKGQMF